MSTLARKLILAALGLLAGAAVWPAAELVLHFQPRFASYLPFLAVLGALTGLLLGAVFGSAEGITSRIRSRIPTGMLLGALVGLVGGAVGLLAGQAALWLFGEAALRSYRSFRTVVLPVSRAIGWGVLGLFVGVGEGVRAASLKKAAVGALGGLVGGLAGGFALEYATLVLPKLAYPRLLGFLILGLAIGVFYGLVERGLSHGVLRLLAGPLKGKEFLLNQRRLNIGRARSNQIALPGYAMADRQARIRVRRGEVSLVNLEPRVPVLVNERKVEETRLKYGDVLAIGPAKLFFKYE
jgi:Inner membrane component of T3SS, cytoplasmic domain